MLDQQGHIRRSLAGRCPSKSRKIFPGGGGDTSDQMGKCEDEV